jgi:hypothetical protein
VDAKPTTLLILAALLVLVPGCAGDEESETVSLYGTLYVGPELGDPPGILSGGHVDGHDDAGELLAEGSEPWPDTSPAYYRVRGLPPEAHVNVVAWAEPAEEAGDDDDSAGEAPVAYVKTVHAAWMPPATLYTYDGELFILELDWLAYHLKLLSKVGLGQAIDGAVAPEIDDTGGFALGTMADPELAEGTRIFVVSGDDKPVEAVYLDGFGIARPELVGVGASGEFGIFGLPAGPAEVQLFDAADVPLGRFPVLIVEDACTALFDLELVP